VALREGRCVHWPRGSHNDGGSAPASWTQTTPRVPKMRAAMLRQGSERQ